MPDIYKPLLNIAGDWFTTLVRRRLGQKRRAEKAQARTLPVLLKTLARTKRGKELGLLAKMPAAEFQAKVPHSDHRDLQPWIERVKAGEADLLWSGTC